MTRVLHTADTHLGYRQYHTPERRADFQAAFRGVIEDAIEDDVDAVVHAGDLFHDRRPGLVDILGTLEVLETLADADIPFLAVVGNHETKRDAQWLDLFERLGVAVRLGRDPVVVEETAFYGLDFVPRGQREQLEYEFVPHDADHVALVSHGLFEPLVPDYGNVEWDAETVLEDATVEFDAMLLGDEHTPTTKQVDDTWVTYCGSTERTSASEREERGYNLVTFDDDVRISRRGLETRPFVFVDLELGDSEGSERIRDRLTQHDLDGAVVHVTLEGGGESVSPARIETFASEHGALVARVTDRREIAVDESTPEVSFADPDEAVRERLRDLGLSEAARNIDETIRSGAVPDSNVADEIERRVEDLLEEPSTFGAEANSELESSESVGDSSAEESESGSSTDEADGESTTDETDDGAISADSNIESETTDAEADPTPAEAENETDPNEDNGQASMEEYL